MLYDLLRMPVGRPTHTLIIQLVVVFFFKDIGWDMLSESAREDKVESIRKGVTLIMLLGRRLLGRFR